MALLQSFGNYGKKGIGCEISMALHLLFLVSSALDDDISICSH